MPKAAASHEVSAYGLRPAGVPLAQGLSVLREAGIHVSEPAGADGLSAAWFAAVIEELPAAVYITDAQGTVLYANRQAAQLVGRAPRPGQDRFTITHRLLSAEGVTVPPEMSPMAISLRDAAPIRGTEMQLERPDGVRVPVMPMPTPLLDARGEVCGGFMLLIDISARKNVEQKLAESYRRDGLTGLPNRPALSCYLAERMAQVRQGGESLLALRLDLDSFKALNDEHGHRVGDAVLSETARRLSAALGSAFIARTGGDEFMVVVSAAPGGEEASPLIRQVQAVFEEEFVCGELRLPISASGGCARFPQDGDDEIRLVAAANAALKLAKAEGAGTVRLYDSQEQAREQERQNFRRDLRAAIDSQVIVPHYQPLFRADGTIAGFEALARWQDPHRGLVAPASFIAAAEEEGALIAKLDAYILRSACIEAASWPKPLRISVNISALEFQSGDLPGRVEDVLTETGLDPERLELEITEGVMVTDADSAMSTFAKLRALGVRIALDDFGTGYSSLSYLHRFPLTTLKIDRSFIAKLGVTLESVAITRAVIQLGHALGFEVVAEGVETPEQLDFLVQEGCDLAQGYLLGRPDHPDAYAELIGA